MRFYHQAVKAKVQCPLRQFIEILPRTSHVARVSEERHLRIAGTHLHRQLPARKVAVLDFLASGKAAMNHAKLLYARLIKPFQCSYPKVNIRIHRILYQYRNIRIFQCVSYFLHKERIRGSPGADPYHIDSEFQTIEDMFLTGDLGGHFHTKFILDPLEPFQAGSSDSLEIVRMGTRFPNPGAEDIDSGRFKSARCLHHLYFRFSAAWSGNEQRALSLGEKSPFLHRQNI